MTQQKNYFEAWKRWNMDIETERVCCVVLGLGV